MKFLGDSCEAQILVAGQRYMDRPTVLENILNDLFHVFRYETCQNLKQALDILLLAMERLVCSVKDKNSLELVHIQAQPREAHPDLRERLPILCCQVGKPEKGLECESEEEDPGDAVERDADTQGGPHYDEERMPDSLSVPDSSRCTVRLRETGQCC